MRDAATRRGRRIHRRSDDALPTGERGQVLATKKTKKKKAAAPRGSKAAKSARRGAKGATNGASKGLAGMHPDEAAFRLREDEIRAVSRDDRPQGRYSFEESANIALQAWERMKAHADAIADAEASIPGTAEAFAALPEYGRALRYAQAQYLLAQGSESNARVPAEIVEETKTLTERMSSVITYNLDHDVKIVERLKYLASGLGYRHSALELEEYASIYEDRADDLAHDRRRYRPADALRARELSVQISDLIGRPKGGSLAEWAELRAGAYTLLERTYERLIRLLGAIEHDRPRGDFPALGSAVRSLRAGRSGRRVEDEDDDTDDVTPPPPTNGTPSPDELPS